MVKLLIQYGADVNDFWGGDSALAYAMAGGDLACARMLCKHGAEVSPKSLDAQPIHALVEYIEESDDFSQLLDFLVEQGVDLDAPDENGQTALHNAVRFASHGQVDALLKVGADVNAKDKYGRTPLRLAVANDLSEIGVLLLHSGGTL